jgi:hypothetical protein
MFGQPHRGCVKASAGGHNPVGVGGDSSPCSQGSSFLATLGFGLEPRWGSQTGLAAIFCILALLLAAAPCPAEDFYADDQESLEKAIDDAAGSADAENVINLDRISIGVSDAIVIDAGFGPDRRLTIRPRPGLSSRAQLRSINGAAPVVSLSHVGHVTLQDLDLLRATYNRSNILHLTDVTNVVVERCRVGSVSSSGGQAGTANIGIFRPVQVVVRNTICFAYAPGTFDRGILVNEATASQAGLWLYNNLVADHRRFGIDITASGDSTLVLRNNVVVNHATAVTPEPAAYRSMVDSFTRVISSHNVAFASPVLAKIEQRDWDQDIANADQPDFFQRDRPSAALAFYQTRWATTPDANPNWNFFRLRDDGPLHQGGSVRGFASEEDEIDPLDIAFADDIEKDARPSDHGGLSHFDRGPDQFRPLTAGDLTLSLRPRLHGLEPIRLSGGRFEVVAVGPQEDLPPFQTVMRGGDYTAGGKLNGIAGMALALPRPVTLAVQLDAGNTDLKFSWPLWAENYTVEEAAAIGGGTPDPSGNWRPVTQPPMVEQESFTFRVTPMPTGNRFYRLRKSD